MKLTEDIIKENFAHNLSAYRKALGLTQGELAEDLSYSDKAVSKWERAESLPDVFTLSRIAELFSVTVDELIGEKKDNIKRSKKGSLRNRLIITALSVALVWLVAVFSHFVLRVSLPDFKSWILFVYALPVSAIVCIVFSCIWWTKLCRFASISVLIWTLVTSVFVTFPNIENMWQIYTVAAVFQGMTVLWFLLKKQKK